MKHRRRIVLAEGIESSVTSEKIEKNAMSDVNISSSVRGRGRRTRRKTAGLTRRPQHKKL